MDAFSTSSRTSSFQSTAGNNVGRSSTAQPNNTEKKKSLFSFGRGNNSKESDNSRSGSESSNGFSGSENGSNSPSGFNSRRSPWDSDLEEDDTDKSYIVPFRVNEFPSLSRDRNDSGSSDFMGSD